MVGVIPSHRRRGIFKALMLELLDDARKRGESIMVLWAAEGGIYSQFGFGLGTKNARIDIESSRAMFREPLDPVGKLRLIGLDEARAVLPPIYDRVRIETPGMLVRSPEWWDAYRLADPEHERGSGGPLQCCVIAVGGRDEGYVLYRLHPQYEHRLHHDWLEVIEAMANSADTTRELWGYLLGMDLVQRIRADFLPRGSPAAADARRAGAAQIHPLRRALAAIARCGSGTPCALVRRCGLDRPRHTRCGVRVE